MKLIDWSIKHTVTILVLIVVLTIAGLGAYAGLPREAAPDITIPVVLVTTPYVGVSPSDIETLVTQPLEDELKQLKDVRIMRSTSAEGASIVSIEFEPSVDIENALQKIRERVDQAVPELPADAETPIVQEISFSEFPIMLVTIRGDVGVVRLKKLAEQLQDRIERVEGILEVKLIGGLEREIVVEADPKLLAYYKVSLGEVMGAIQQSNVNLPGGSVEVGDLKYSVRVPGEFERIGELENLIVRREKGRPIYLKDVAHVVDSYEQPKTYARVNAEQSISLSISRRGGENVLRIAGEIKDIVREFEDQYGEQVRFAVLADVSKAINSQVSELENNILTGLILVAGVLLFFMGGLRNALFVAIAIPLSMLISFAVLSAMEITLNIVVLFSLVLALGMLVDNAIVIVENIYRHANMGKPLAVAALEGSSEVAWPIIASTATTVGAFFPMMFWPGIMGEFMGFLPLTVIIVLLSSLFVALVINPVICAAFMKVKGVEVKSEEEIEAAGPPDPREELEALPDNVLYRLYAGTLKFSVQHRWVVGVITVGTFIGTFMLYGKYQAGVEFFPQTTPERAFLNVNLPDGSNLEASNRAMHAMEKLLPKHKNIENFQSGVGSGNGNQMDFGAGGSAPHKSQITLDFLDEAEQVENPLVTLEEIRKEMQFVGVDVEIVKESGGPPSGLPINIELVGTEYGRLGALSQTVEDLVEAVPGVVNLKSDYQAGRPEITVVVDKEAAALVGISTQDVANTVRFAINGVEASVFREYDEEYDIIVRLPERSRSSIEDISGLLIKNRDADQIPITEIADVRTERGFGSIRHIDGDRVVTVSADVAEGYMADSVLKEVQEVLAAEVQVPAGYELRYTGQNKDQEEAQAFLSKALLAAMFIIALVLVTQFNSVLQPFIIMCSVVLSLLGVLWILMLRQLPFSVIMTGVGIISLVGVVVNNAIVLIDYINQLKERGLDSQEAVVQAGLVRFRPVMLTAITTLLSLMPIVLGFSLDVKNFDIVFGGRSVEMWGPMANAVSAGLLVATLLTLVVVPVMYSGMDSFCGFMRRILSREERAARRAQKAEQRASDPRERPVSVPTPETV